MSVALLTWTSQLAIQYVSFVVIVVESQSRPTLWNPMSWSTPGFPILQHHQEFDQSRIHWAKDAMQPSHPLLTLLLQPTVFPSIRVFSNESHLLIKWPKYWSFSFSPSPSNEYSGLISFRIDWFDFLPAQGTLKSPLTLTRCLTTVQRHQLFGAQTFILSSSHIHKWLLEKP